MLKNILMTSAAAIVCASAASAEYKLRILHINDLHSRVEPINKYDSTCNAEDNAEGKCFGGYARVATKIAELRAKYADENLIVLDAGDQYQGSLMYTTYKGDAEIEFAEAIGFDAMAVGNHEFDDGDEGLAKLADGVSFPIVSGNIDVSGSPVIAGKIHNHVVLEVGGQKIGIVSALAADTVETSSPSAAVIFNDEITSLQADVDALEAEGINKIIALNHVGISKDLEIAAQVSGLDAVIGGHSHTEMSNTKEDALAYPQMVGDVPVAQAYAYSKYLGELVLTFDDAGTVTNIEGDAILLDASVAEDEAIKARIAELAGPIDEMKNRIVAQSAANIDGDRNSCRAVECQMGNLVTEAMLDRVKDQGIEIAIQNGGGLRSSIDAGDVTMGEVLTVLPFQNTLSTFQVTGASVVAALENGVSRVEEGSGRFPQVAGITFAFDASKEAGSRVSDVLVAGAPIDLEKVYGVVSNNYVRNGGDGYKMFIDAQNAYDFGPDLADVTAEFIAKSGAYTPFIDGRITVK